MHGVHYVKGGGGGGRGGEEGVRLCVLLLL